MNPLIPAGLVLITLSSCGNPTGKQAATRSDVLETWADGSPRKTVIRDAATNETLSEIELYDNETTFREWKFKAGLKNGESRSFREDGKPWSLNSYVNDTLHGPYRTWHENGQLYIDGTYTMGVRSGIWNFYAPDGRLVRTHDFTAAPSIIDTTAAP
ncbi:MAG: toxin-antitoxin system YwqK family antitoxin [Flavobacteriales bacterium]|jgi:antitoxin component YwqK of YwqJK toxin-antitoxin module